MGHFEPTPGLDRIVAEKIAAPRLRRVLDMLHDEARHRAPTTRVWISARDERVRPSHRDADTQVIPDNLRFLLPTPTGHDLARYPRDPTLPPGQRINCFTGDTRVVPLGTLRAVWRQAHAGTVVRLTTECGRVLTGTPNHPMLTPSGMVRLGALNEGDHLIHGSIGETPTRAAGTPEAPQVNDGPANIEQVFHAAALSLDPQRVPRGSVDLYGDTADGDVEVVAIDRELRDRLEAVGRERHREFALTPSHELLRALPDLRLRDQLIGASAFAASGSVSRASEPLAILGRRACHTDGHRLAATPPWYSGVAQPDFHDAAVNTEGPSDCLFGLSGEVTTDKVIHIELDHGFSGHVYTLTTSEGLFTANGLVASNCRCDDPTLPDLLRDDIRTSDLHITGNRVSGEVYTTFHRAAESNYASPPDAPSHFMDGALMEVAARLRNAHAR